MEPFYIDQKHGKYTTETTAEDCAFLMVGVRMDHWHTGGKHETFAFGAVDSAVFDAAEFMATPYIWSRLWSRVEEIIAENNWYYDGDSFALSFAFSGNKDGQRWQTEILIPLDVDYVQSIPTANRW